RGVPLGLHPLRELAGQGGLARALEAGEHDHGGRGLGEVQVAGGAAEHLDKLVVDELDDLLGGVERLGDLFAQRSLTDPAGDLAPHRDGDVGVEQGTADLADRLVDVRLGEAAMAAQTLQRCCDAIGEVVEHEALPLGRMDRISLVRAARPPQDARSGPQERTATPPCLRPPQVAAASISPATILPVVGGSSARPCWSVRYRTSTARRPSVITCALRSSSPCSAISSATSASRLGRLRAFTCTTVASREAPGSSVTTGVSSVVRGGAPGGSSSTRASARSRWASSRSSAVRSTDGCGRSAAAAATHHVFTAIPSRVVATALWTSSRSRASTLAIAAKTPAPSGAPRHSSEIGPVSSGTGYRTWAELLRRTASLTASWAERCGARRE